MRARALTVLALAAGAAAAPLLAQDAGSPRALAGAEYYSLSFGSGLGTKSLHELIVPLGFTVPVGRRLLLDAGTYYVNAKRTDEAGASGTVSGLTDVVLRGACWISTYTFLLSFRIFSAKASSACFASCESSLRLSPNLADSSVSATS